MTRTGRPPEFTRRHRFLVTLEEPEYRRLQAVSAADSVSASAWVRRLVLAALARRARRRSP
jgi:hypothetical protein